MTRCRIVFAVLLLLLAGQMPCGSAAWAGPAAGDDAAGDKRPADSAGVVRASLRPALLTAKPGETVEFEVSFQVQKGWHLYAHGDTAYYGIELTGFEGSALAGASIDYPPGKAGEFFGEPVQLLTGRQRIRVKAPVAATAAGGAHFLPLALELQACDDQACLAPAKVALPLRLEVAGQH